MKEGGVGFSAALALGLLHGICRLSLPAPLTVNIKNQQSHLTKPHRPRPTRELFYFLSFGAGQRELLRVAVKVPRANLCHPSKYIPPYQTTQPSLAVDDRTRCLEGRIFSPINTNTTPKVSQHGCKVIINMRPKPPKLRPLKYTTTVWLRITMRVALQLLLTVRTQVSWITLRRKIEELSPLSPTC